jgi:hypothetical protein
VTARTRKRFNLISGWFYIVIAGPLGLYAMIELPDLWQRLAVFAVYIISVETAAFTHFAAAAADTKDVA